MALNVWLVFRRAHNGRDLRRLEKWYGVFAYGVPAIAAVGYLVHDLNSRQQVMGPAIVGLFFFSSCGVVRVDLLTW
ncbi:hypothetical protein M3J09_003640 [Ascochyta lentis]